MRIKSALLIAGSFLSFSQAYATIFVKPGVYETEAIVLILNNKIVADFNMKTKSELLVELTGSKAQDIKRLYLGSDIAKTFKLKISVKQSNNANPNSLSAEVVGFKQESSDVIPSQVGNNFKIIE